MTPDLLLFCISLAVTLQAARVFATRLDHLGVTFGLPEAVIGLLTALAADGPEISSALIALAKGAPGVSLGVVVGSNVFNLAAMVGLSALLVGSVCLPRKSLLLEGLVAALAAVIVSALVLGWLSPIATAVLLAVVLIPYLLVLIRGTEPPTSARAEPDEEVVLWKAVAWIPTAVVLIVLGSTGMVETAVSLAHRWHISTAAVGLLILGPLTSIPNAATAVRLGVARRGSALVSETFNSNTINMVVGVAAPALVVSIAGSSGRIRIELAWMLAMTAATLGLLAQRRGIGRAGAMVLIALYAGFVAVEIASG